MKFLYFWINNNGKKHSINLCGKYDFSYDQNNKTVFVSLKVKHKYANSLYKDYSKISDVSAIVGPNESGKTTVFKAINMVFTDSDVEYVFFFEYANGSKTEYGLCGNISGIKYEGIEVNEDNILTSVGEFDKWLKDRSLDFSLCVYSNIYDNSTIYTNGPYLLDKTLNFRLRNDSKQRNSIYKKAEKLLFISQLMEQEADNNILLFEYPKTITTRIVVNDTIESEYSSEIQYLRDKGLCSSILDMNEEKQTFSSDKWHFEHINDILETEIVVRTMRLEPDETKKYLDDKVSPIDVDDMIKNIDQYYEGLKDSKIAKQETNPQIVRINSLQTDISALLDDIEDYGEELDIDNLREEIERIAEQIDDEFGDSETNKEIISLFEIQEIKDSFNEMLEMSEDGFRGDGIDNGDISDGEEIDEDESLISKLYKKLENMRMRLALLFEKISNDSKDDVVESDAFILKSQWKLNKAEISKFVERKNKLIEILEKNKDTINFTNDETFKFRLPNIELIDVLGRYENNDNYLEILFEHDDLSSGQYSFYELLHELYKCNSDIKKRREERGRKSSEVIILIDEGEVFLHPNLQIKYIKSILKYLQAYFEAASIQLVVSTNSPFILSDIQSANVCCLDSDHKIYESTIFNTFGSNISDLLIRQFFMQDGLMGKQSKDILDDVIDVLKQKEISEVNLEESKSVIDITGNQIVRRKLEQMYTNHLCRDDIEKEIEYYQKKIERLHSLK